jgi:hypothetical protein
MTKGGADVSRRLFEDQRHQGNGHFPARLSSAGLRKLCDQEINRIGLVPELHDGRVSAPGANPNTIGLRHRNAAHLLPSLEHEIRCLADLILATSPGVQEREDGSDLPGVAEQPSPQPPPPAEASGAVPASEEI